MIGRARAAGPFSATAPNWTSTASVSRPGHRRSGAPLPLPPFACLKSGNDYGHFAQRELRFAEFRDATSSGAETEDMTQAHDVSPGPNPPQLDSLSPDTRLEARILVVKYVRDPASQRRGCIRGCPSLAGRALAALQGIFEKAGVSSRGELVAKLFAAHHARSRLDRPERPGAAVV